MTNRKWDMASQDVQKHCLDEVIGRIEEMQDSQVGMVAAQDIIDIVTEHFGPAIYNAGVKAVRKKVQDRLADLDTEIDLLEV